MSVARPALAQNGLPARVEKTLVSRLDNGLEVLLSEARGQPVFSLALRYRVGGRHDPAVLDELAHLVEHLAFQPSRHIATHTFEITDPIGVRANGVTNDDDTVYTSSGPIGALKRVLWLERQRMAFTLETISQQDVVSERRILDNERSSRRADRVGGMFWHFVGAALYPPGHPYAPRPERGCILRCELRQVQWLMQRGYRPDNARLVVAGDFDADAMLAHITGVFGSIENPSVRLPAPAQVPPRAGQRRITVAAPVPRSRLHLFWDVPQALRARYSVLRVLRFELEQQLDRDLVDTVGFATDADVDLAELELGWLWSIGVDLAPGMDPKHVEQRVLAHVSRLRSRAVAIEASRQAVITGLLRAWDDPSGRVWLLADDRSFGFDLPKAIAELKRVSAEDVKILAGQLLHGAPRLSVRVLRAVDADPRGELYREPE